jgi:aminoglycoside phosphotransferase (APT) family kinase protein
VLVDGDRLAAVLDLGALAVGDPTVDLTVAWDLIGPTDRTIFRDRLGIDGHTWARGRAWALALALVTLPYYWRTMPERCASRLTLARAVLADADTE